MNSIRGLVEISQYPKLMEYDLIGERYIVFMWSEGCGVVIESACKNVKVGDVREDWLMEASGHVYFVPYRGTIELSNSF